MKKQYDPQNIEKKVQEYWKIKNTFQVFEDSKKKKYYCLAMLPYPSGKLHMGHVRNYTISDVIARFQRMLGKNVLHPIGWDAFGLPAEEAALKNHLIPSKWTEKNINFMKKQLQRLGFSYDWSREIKTCDPEYYQWEQWFFNKIYQKNMVYKKKSLVNWCPQDKTVLANEQVINGQCWRCQSDIILKHIPQWFIRITNYAEKLLKDLKLLTQWPKKIIKMQENWIGKSSGFEISLNILNTKEIIKIYTNQLHLIMGVTFIAISPEHTLSQEISQTNETIKHFLQTLYKKNYFYLDKNNINIVGKKIEKYAIHPITNELLPIWITNYTSIEYNTDSRLSIPGHNKYDWQCAKKYQINIKNVISCYQPNQFNIHHFSENNKGILCNSGIFNGLNEQEASNKIFKILNQKKIIQKKNNFKLKDWSISRQRYWGAPIPMMKNQYGKILPIPNEKLPIILPKINNMDDLKNIKNIYKNWSKIKIKNEHFIKETDTFDTFMESSWYYIRYTSPHLKTKMLDQKAANYWLPIDQYIGGIEHAIMHLIYFRFYHKLLYDLNLVSCKEPVKKLLCQGMVLSDAFYYINKKNQKTWISYKELKIQKNQQGETKNIQTIHGKKIIHAGMIKMSKSKKNGVEPELMIKKYGADTIRLFIMFAAPVETELEWNEAGVKGMYRFLQKIWNISYETKYNIKEKNIIPNNSILIKKLQSELNNTIKKVDHNIKIRQSFNTAISEIMKFTNSIINYQKNNQCNYNFIKEALNNIIKMLYPFTPHISFSLWKELNNEKTIDFQEWPKYNEKYILKEYINIIVQINGKKKDIIKTKYNNSKENILNILKTNIKTKKILKINTVQRIIYIQNKLINLII
ncbi:leucine--tRNA ligase [Buchnera aphidicola]|uniref:leucine--tRNA ligase n=1 Tax=Buchnera aphidicola TaxID=9 RepID=UPI0034645178